MKINTYISKSFYILLFFALFSSCKKDELPSKPVPSAFSITASTAGLIPAAGASVNISITGGSNGWWIVIPETQKSWVSITRVYGSGNVEVPVVIKANTSAQERSVEITVSPTFNLNPEKVVFRQAGL